MPIIEFRFTNLTSVGSWPKDAFDLYVDVEADLQVLVDGGVLYSEHNFPVIELAEQLLSWIQPDRPEFSDFYFLTQSAEEKDLFWVKTTDGRCRLGSRYQEFEHSEGCSIEELRSAVADFARRLTAECRVVLNGRIEETIPEFKPFAES